MKTIFSFLILIITISFIYGCGSESGNKEEAANQETISNIDSVSNQAPAEVQLDENTEREPTDDEIREFGIISNIEDGAYPMFVVTIEFPERKMKHDFNLNIEAISLDENDLYGLKDKYVSFYYFSEFEQNLYDITYKGNSLLGEYAPERDPEWKKITGILNGAESESVGDLPDEISVTDKNGKVIKFKDFITSEVAAANGKDVTVYYSGRYYSIITYMQPTVD